ncbi:MAG: HAMP domain-containing histidine kinase [Erysipelothrix sp.]|nr:HAMP domain-containing histidine kinase [Erysipelothrix sp.]
MNKLNKKNIRLSLTQQLVAIVLAFVVIFLAFFFSYLNNSINEFVRIEMDNFLSSSQTSIIEAYEINNNGKFLHNLKEEDELSHKIWDRFGEYQTETFRYLPPIVRRQISIERHLLITQAKTHTLFQTSESVDGYVVEMNYDAMNDVTYVSVVSKMFSQNLRSRLLSSLVNGVLIIVVLLFTAMFLWVSSIIRSLGIIQDYVNKITKEEDSDLEINRQDELGEVAKALVYMNQELKKQEKVKEELIQNISHDLKTPIATIKSYGESIKDGIYPYDTLEKSVDVIIEHAYRLEQKVHSLLLFNRMDYLISNKSNEEINLKDIVDKTIMSIMPINANVEIINETEDAFFVGEEESWRVVCENILDNALRYAQTYIKVELSEDHLRISNDGTHLSEKVRDTMFKPYEKGTDGGYGMGLSIVLKVVSAYGYTIDAVNTNDGVAIEIHKKDIG